VKIISIVPIDKNSTKETLDYFSSKDLLPRSLVTVPLGKKAVFGIVLSSREALDAKAELKAGRFSLKKIFHPRGESKTGFFLAPFLEAASMTARYFALTTGSVLSSLIPAKVLEEYAKERNPLHSLSRQSFSADEPEGGARTQVDAVENSGNLKQDKLVLMQDFASRMSAYRALIREEFARDGSVFLAVPETDAAENIFRELSRGIEQYSFLFHGRLPGKKTLSDWRKAYGENHPVLVIGTPGTLSLPRKDIGLIILEDEGSDAYRTFSRPHFDKRYFIEAFAERMRVKILLGSSLLRVETWHRHEIGELAHRDPLCLRMQERARREIIDARRKEDQLSKNAEFRAITEPLANAALRALRSGNVLLYGARRGLAPMTICRDCGTIVSCVQCSMPVVLHRKSAKEENNFFLCHRCGHRRSAAEKCAHCLSWRLSSIGIGIESAADEARLLFPDASVVEVSSDARVQARDLPLRGAVVIGGTKALRTSSSFALSGALSLDPLFLLPDFRIRERILRILLALQSKTDGPVFLQTRRPDEEVFAAWKRGDLVSVYRTEIRERERFAYPPFSVLVKISWSGSEAGAKEKAERIRALFEEYSPRIFPAFAQIVRGRTRIHCVLKVERESWPNEDILRRLFSLPPEFTVSVDPEDLL